MNDSYEKEIKEELYKEVEELNRIINEKEKIIAIIGLLNIKGYSALYAKIKGLQSIINRSMQCGNYQRAFRYIVFTKKYLKLVLSNEYDAVNQMTDIMIK